MDADVRRAERAEAKRNAPVLLPLALGQIVTFDCGEWGESWGRVLCVIDADRAEVELNYGGRLTLPRAMLKGGS
jgi:hypothetical protein